MIREPSNECLRQASSTKTALKIRTDPDSKQSSMANKSAKLIFLSIALLLALASVVECMKRTQYHEQVGTQADL